MGRVIGAVIAGSAVMLIGVFVMSALAWMALGAEGAFLPGSYRTSSMWIALSLALSFLAALLGGWAGATVARSDRRATKGLGIGRSAAAMRQRGAVV